MQRALTRLHSLCSSGQGSVLGNASMALEELGASLLDLRAVLAGLLNEMKLLPELVCLHRWAVRGRKLLAGRMLLVRGPGATNCGASLCRWSDAKSAQDVSGQVHAVCGRGCVAVVPQCPGAQASVC